ncbi:hypothetical protein WH47_00794 [Habropoda laboriosa]|uniref:Uncharacterized protein n=1 Tax=Habropoda laboriosa TaxID=597456 RepID=A0A0L7QK19_9HYME|nr:hypothetical protein WH47_00794 [Habropoda laboriosa]
MEEKLEQLREELKSYDCGYGQLGRGNAIVARYYQLREEIPRANRHGLMKINKIETEFYKIDGEAMSVYWREMCYWELGYGGSPFFGHRVEDAPKSAERGGMGQDREVNRGKKRHRNGNEEPQVMESTAVSGRRPAYGFGQHQNKVSIMVVMRAIGRHLERYLNGTDMPIVWEVLWDSLFVCGAEESTVQGMVYREKPTRYYNMKKHMKERVAAACASIRSQEIEEEVYEELIKQF